MCAMVFAIMLVIVSDEQLCMLIVQKDGRKWRNHAANSLQNGQKRFGRGERRRYYIKGKTTKEQMEGVRQGITLFGSQMVLASISQSERLSCCVFDCCFYKHLGEIADRVQNRLMSRLTKGHKAVKDGRSDKRPYCYIQTENVVNQTVN